MEVMTLHKWHDEDVEKVLWEGHEDNREIILKNNNESALVINKRDVVALAHEFNLVVYPKDANLQPWASSVTKSADTKPCGFCKEEKREYLWNFCKVCGRPLDKPS